MTLKKLTSLGTYEQINSGAHRKAASIAGVPALVRHLGFWNIGFTTPGAVDGRLPMAARARNYRDYAARLRSFVTDKSRSNLRPSTLPPVDNDPDLDSSAVTLVRFWWYGIFATVRLEFHTEYIALTSILDLSASPPTDFPAHALQNKYRLALLKHLDLMADHADGVKISAGDVCARTSEYIQISVWDHFEKTVINRAQGGEEILTDMFGEIFVDLRGLVTGSKSVDKESSDAPFPYVLRKPGVRAVPRRRMRRELERKCPPENWAEHMLRRCWPFIEAEEHLYDYEFSVSRFLDGRALFVTALGPNPPPDKSSEPAWSPIRWFLHTYIDNEWQIGRLVDRINTMGTLRLAATMQIAALKAAGNSIEQLAADVEQTNAAIDNAIRIASAEPTDISEDQPPSEQKTRKEQEEAAKKLVELADFKNKALGESSARINAELSGDILHRVERSQYYFDQFIKESKALRADRFEGFQMYPEFVARRMSGIMGYIQFLEARVRSVRGGISEVSRKYASLKITTVTVGIDQLVSGMGKQDREIKNIQDFGEIALIGVLIPYYSSAIVVERILELKGWTGGFVSLLILSLCLGELLRRFVLRAVKKPAGRTYSLLAAGAILLGVGLAWCALFEEPHVMWARRNLGWAFGASQHVKDAQSDEKLAPTTGKGPDAGKGNTAISAEGNETKR